MSPLHYTQEQEAGYDTETDHKTKNRDLEPGSPHEESYGTGPTDPYTSHTEDGKPVITADELRIAGKLFWISQKMELINRCEAYRGYLCPARSEISWSCLLWLFPTGLWVWSRWCELFLLHL